MPPLKVSLPPAGRSTRKRLSGGYTVTALPRNILDR